MTAQSRTKFHVFVKCLTLRCVLPSKPRFLSSEGGAGGEEAVGGGARGAMLDHHCAITSPSLRHHCAITVPGGDREAAQTSQ